MEKYIPYENLKSHIKKERRKKNIAALKRSTKQVIGTIGSVAKETGKAFGTARNTIQNVKQEIQNVKQEYRKIFPKPKLAKKKKLKPVNVFDESDLFGGLE